MLLLWKLYHFSFWIAKNSIGHYKISHYSLNNGVYICMLYVFIFSMNSGSSSKLTQFLGVFFFNIHTQNYDLQIFYVHVNSQSIQLYLNSFKASFTICIFAICYQNVNKTLARCSVFLLEQFMKLIQEIVAVNQRISYSSPSLWIYLFYLFRSC